MTAYDQGYKDGYEAVRESGTSTPPLDGWHVWAINGVGISAFLETLGLPYQQRVEGDEPRGIMEWLHYAANRPEWNAVELAAFAEYDLGAQDGADAAAVAGVAGDLDVSVPVL